MNKLILTMKLIWQGWRNYFLDIISPYNDKLDKMNKLFATFPEIDKVALGFPVGWENEPLWQ